VGAVFVRYTDVVILGCVAVAILLVRWLAPAVLPRRAPFWWIASAAVFGLLLLIFNSLVYGSALSPGYLSEWSPSVSALWPATSSTCRST
jgi:hypothetical protein